MECVRKEDKHDENEDPADNNCQFTSDIVNKKCDSIAAMTASERLNATCFRMVNENSCSQVNCKYSNDKAVIAAAREKQMTDLTAIKRDMRAKHQKTMRAYEAMGAKAFKQGVTTQELNHNQYSTAQ
jgi:hypothetical protein